MDASGVRCAIGHAASQAAGTFAALGTSGVKVHQARGALAGFLAAELAGAGLDASETALTAERGGLLASYADGGLPDRLIDALGRSWDLESVALRRWPVASSLQAVVEAALAIRAELGLEPGVRGGLADVAEARVELPSRAYALNGAPGWRTRLSALQSARWTVAVVIEDGEAWLDQTSDSRRGDAVVAAFATGSVHVAEDPALAKTGARVTLRTRAGATLTREIEAPPGDPQRPLSEGEIREKLGRGITAAGLDDRTASIVEGVAALGTAPKARTLIARLGA
jgi:2-methylcitrate dehydratase PrpD